MQQKPPDIKLLLDALAKEEVRWVLVGGLAVSLYGGDNVTFDIDLSISFDVVNRESLVRALAPLNPRPIRIASYAYWTWDILSIRGPWTILQTDAGRVDLIVRLPGVDSFEGLYKRSEVRSIFGHQIRVASLNDLISMKEQSDRYRDRDHLRQLYAIRNITRKALDQQ